MNSKLCKNLRKVAKARGWDRELYQQYKALLESLDAEGRAQAAVLMERWAKGELK